MPEIGTSSSMSGDRKRGVGHRPQATAPILDSTTADSPINPASRPRILPPLPTSRFRPPPVYRGQQESPRAPLSPLVQRFIECARDIAKRWPSQIAGVLIIGQNRTPRSNRPHARARQLAVQGQNVW